MNHDEPSQAERDDVMGAAVALLRAAQAEDIEGGDLILDSVNLRHLAGLLAGLCNTLGTTAYGEEQWRDALVRWRPGTRLGDPDPPDE
jgi:hypothetical protein